MTSSNRRDGLHLIHFDPAGRFLDEGGFGKAAAPVKCLKPYALNLPHSLGLTMDLQTWLRYKQGRLEEARFER